MVIAFLDTSAAMKLLVDEPESDPLTAHLQAMAGEEHLVASWLLHVELHYAANRHPADVELESVAVVLDTLALLDLTRGDLLPPARLRSNDAIHLAVALRVGADEMITYDAELAAAADGAGLRVVQPRGPEPLRLHARAGTHLLPVRAHAGVSAASIAVILRAR